MNWMIGQNGRTSMPSSRLDIGAKPNINIHSTKITNVNYGDGSIFPNGAGYGMGYGMYGMPPYESSSYSKTEGTLATIQMFGSFLTDAVGLIKNLIKTSPDETPGTES